MVCSFELLLVLVRNRLAKIERKYFVEMAWTEPVSKKVLRSEQGDSQEAVSHFGKEFELVEMQVQRVQPKAALVEISEPEAAASVLSE